MHSDRGVRFLEGLTVLEWGTGIGGAYAGSVLASLGADVFVVEGRRSHPAFEVLDRNKRVVTTDASDPAEVSRRVGAEIVLCDRVGGSPEGLPSRAAEYSRTVERVNSSVWVTLSAFGLDGPYADRFASDFTLSAATAISAYVRESDTGRSLVLPGYQALLAGGQSAALAALHGWDLMRVRQQPVHVDLSSQEAAVATGPVLQCAERLLQIKVGGTRRFGAPFGSYACSDGWVYVGAAEDHQWLGVVKAIAAPQWAAELTDSQSRAENAERIDQLVGEWAAGRTKRDAQDVLQTNGVPAGESNSFDDLYSSPQFDVRDAWVDDAGSEHRMGSPFLRRSAGTPGAGTGHGPAGIAGLRLIEASHILSGSVAGALLGVMGADVVKVEDPQRLDLYRRQGPFINGERHVDRSGYFTIANHSKSSFLLSDKADLGRLVEDADAVLENWGVGRAGREGVDCDSVARRHPNKLGVSVSGFGHTGPYQGYRVYAYILNAYCGLAETLRSPSGAPAALDFAWADFTSAYSAATVVAAWAVGRARGYAGGAAIDLSMAEILVERLNLVVALGLGARRDRDREGLYAIGADGPTVAVSFASELDQSTLDSLGLSSVDDMRAPIRRDASDVPQNALADVIAELESRGLCAAALCDADALIADPNLASRGFFAEFDDPQWSGLRVIGVPWRVAGEGALRLTAPPRLGSRRTADSGEPESLARI